MRYSCAQHKLEPAVAELLLSAAGLPLRLPS